MPRINFGLTLSNRLPIINPQANFKHSLLDLGAKAEQSGYFNSLWVGDNILTRPRGDSITVLASLASVTEKVRLGTACMATFILRNPLFLAQQWATLDCLSGGRTVLIACLGGTDGKITGAEEFKVFGYSLKDRVKMFTERIDAIRKLWTGDSVSYSGTFDKFENVTVEPKPLQKPPPIWIAGHPRDPSVEEKQLRRIAMLADGWMGNLITPEEFRYLWDKIREYAASGGRNINESILYCNACIDDDKDKAARQTEAFLSTYYTPQFYNYLKSKSLVELWVAYGGPRVCVNKIESYIRAGAKEITLRFTALEDQHHQLERFVKEVAPSFT